MRSIIATGILGTLLLASCTTTTRLDTVWKNKTLEGFSPRRILIIAVSDRDGARRLYEERFVAALKKSNIRIPRMRGSWVYDLESTRHTGWR